jgi:predicted nucleic-acid-binding Zn-ribbon protein
MRMANDFQRRAVEALLRAGVGQEKTCPQCGHDEFKILPKMVLQRLVDAEEAREGEVLEADGYAFPCVLRVCKRCGAATYYSAKILGLLDPPGAPPEVN